MSSKRRTFRRVEHFADQIIDQPLHVAIDALLALYEKQPNAMLWVGFVGARYGNRDKLYILAEWREEGSEEESKNETERRKRYAKMREENNGRLPF
jgi:hypothetical protein